MVIIDKTGNTGANWKRHLGNAGSERREIERLLARHCSSVRQRSLFPTGKMCA